MERIIVRSLVSLAVGTLISAAVWSFLSFSACEKEQVDPELELGI